MLVNLKCSQCGRIYDFEVGEVTTDEKMSLVFENKSVCPQFKRTGVHKLD